MNIEFKNLYPWQHWVENLEDVYISYLGECSNKIIEFLKSRDHVFCSLILILSILQIRLSSYFVKNIIIIFLVRLSLHPDVANIFNYDFC